MAFGLIVSLIFLVPCINSCIAQDSPDSDLPPSVKESYGAIGEIVIQYSSDKTVTMIFEENFDFNSRRSVFTASSVGLTTTLYQDMKLKQTFKYEDTLVNDHVQQICSMYTPGQWINVHSPPDLELFEWKEDKVLFPLMQLLWGLTDRTLKQGTEMTPIHYRDIPCNRWTHQIIYSSKDMTVDYVVEVEAYWSDGSWNTSAKETVVPVAFEIHHNGINKTSGKPVNQHQYVNVMHFTKDYFNREAFLPKQGIFCPGRNSSKPFPELGNFSAASIGIEFIWKDYQLDSNIYMQIDSNDRIIQIEYDSLSQYVDTLNRKKKTSSVLIASYDQKFAYEISEDSCKLIPIKEANYDIQTIYDIEYLSSITAEHFFGHKVKYVYIGETIKRGIPCHMWQGRRRGWPPSEPSITTVWEWCIAERVGNPVMLEDGALPIVSLDITVTESQLTADAGTYTLGMKFTYNFYDVFVEEPRLVRTVSCDISPCFTDKYMERLQFKVDLSPKEISAVKNATAKVPFIDNWRTVIYGVTGILPSSLRVAKVKTILIDKGLLVQFVLLDRHPATPAYVPEDVNLKDAKDRLKSAIDSDGVSIDWMNLVLKAKKGSLDKQFEYVKPYVDPPITTTVEETTESSSVTTTSKITTPVHKSTSTASTIDNKDSSSSTTVSSTSADTGSSVTDGSSSSAMDSTTSTNEPSKESRAMVNRYASGTMAGLGIGMLLIGFSLGAGGTFVKFRYF